MTTTIAAIRDRLKTVIESTAPTCPPTDAQDVWRYRPNRGQSVEEWATANAAACFRIFDIRRVGEVADAQGWQPDEIMRSDEQLALTVAYPRLPDLYGESYEAMEDCLRADAAQLRNICVSPSTAAGVSGWSAVTGCTIAEPERGDIVWFQRLVITLAYCESQTLT